MRFLTFFVAFWLPLASYWLPRGRQDAPQDPPKTAPRAANNPQDRPKSGPMPQDRPKSGPRAPKTGLRASSWVFLGGSWAAFGQLRADSQRPSCHLSPQTPSTDPPDAGSRGIRNSSHFRTLAPAFHMRFRSSASLRKAFSQWRFILNLCTCAAETFGKLLYSLLAQPHIWAKPASKLLPQRLLILFPCMS